MQNQKSDEPMKNMEEQNRQNSADAFVANLESFTAEAENAGKKKKHPVLFTVLFLLLAVLCMGAAAWFSFITLSRHTVTFVIADGALTRTVLGTEELSFPEWATPENLTFLGWEDERGNIETRSTVHVWEDTVYTARYRTALNTTDHVPYLFPDEDGLFHADAPMTRQEAALAVYSLLCGKIQTKDAFPDVEEGTPYYTAVAQLKALGVVQGSRFYPEDGITLADLVQLLAAFYPACGEDLVLSWVPEEHDAYRSFCTAVAMGWLDPEKEYDPDAVLTRQEAVRLINRVTGRRAAEKLSLEAVGPMPDCGPFNEDYRELAEAVVAHQYLSGESEVWTDSDPLPVRYVGYAVIDGHLRYADEQGLFITGTNADGLTFGPHGCYTSGNAELDEKVSGILKDIYDPKLSLEEQLRAAFDYIVGNYAYSKHSGDEPVGNSDEDQALRLFTSRTGNCVQNAAGFWALARGLGADAELVRGYHFGCQNHGWVVIHTPDGAYICDPREERANPGVLDWFMMDRRTYYAWGYQPDPNVIDGQVVDCPAARD